MLRHNAEGYPLREIAELLLKALWQMARCKRQHPLRRVAMTVDEVFENHANAKVRSAPLSHLADSSKKRLRRR